MHGKRTSPRAKPYPVEHSPDDLFDVAIVGGGPAGLSAAIWLGRYLHSVVLVDSGDPRNWETRGIHGFLGRPEVRPAELRESGREECRGLGVRLVDGTVELARPLDDELFELVLAGGGRLRARRLLLAIGLRDVWPDVPGLRHAYGDTAHVCPDCDGYWTRGKRVAVIGVGRKAAGMALALATWTRDIVVCTHGRDPRLDDGLREKLDALGVPVHTARIERLRVEDGGELRALELADGAVVEAEHLFFSLAQYPADDLGVQLGCERDDEGHIVIDHAHRTSVAHVYAAGDIVPGPQLAIVAAAEGATAALAIHKSLLPETLCMPKATEGAGAGDR